MAMGCGSTPASELAKTPGLEEKTGLKTCPVKQSARKPLIVEWPSADRGDLENAIERGVVVVRYPNSCEMQLLTRCTAPGRYTYDAYTPKKNVQRFRDADELWANMPIGAAKLEGKLAKAGELAVDMTLVGQYRTDLDTVRTDELKGRCRGATHIIVGATVGAFELFAAAQAQVGASADVMGIGAGAKSTAARDILNRDGKAQACEAGTAKDPAPPEGCGALLRIEVVELGAPKSAEVICPDGTEKRGNKCVRITVVTDVTCPSGTQWNGKKCVASVSRDCPSGMHFESGRGCVPDVTFRPPMPTPAPPPKSPSTITPVGMVLVPAGDFWMGCAQNDKSCLTHFKPKHQVYLDAFYIDKTEVTVAQYRKCVSTKQCTAPTLLPDVYDGGGKDRSSECNWNKTGRDFPITCVDWSQANSFCRWAGKRLPTEAEWEKAARGTDGRIYPWGKAKPSCSYAIINVGGNGCGRDSTWPVGSKPAGKSPYGALDMAGNVTEWVNDWYDSGYYARSSRRNPRGPSRGNKRVVRGSNVASGAYFLVAIRAAYRRGLHPNDSQNALGFRCARSAK